MPVIRPAAGSTGLAKRRAASYTIASVADEQERAVEQRAEHLDAPVTEGAPPIGRARRADRGDERERERENVGADVHGVGRQRQAARYRAAPELKRRDDDRSDQCDGQVTAYRHNSLLPETRPHGERGEHRAEECERLALGRYERLSAPRSVAVRHRIELRNDARHPLAIALEGVAELRPQERLLVRHDLRVERRHRAERAARGERSARAGYSFR